MCACVFWVIFNSHCSGKGAQGGGKGGRVEEKVFSFYTFINLFLFVALFLSFVLKTPFWCSQLNLNLTLGMFLTNSGHPFIKTYAKKYLRLKDT